MLLFQPQFNKGAALKKSKTAMGSIHTVFPHIVSAGNYSFLNLEIQMSQYIRPKVTVHKCAETIQWRKLCKGGNYMSKYGIQNYKIAPV